METSRLISSSSSSSTSNSLSVAAQAIKTTQRELSKLLSDAKFNKNEQRKRRSISSHNVEQVDEEKDEIDMFSSSAHNVHKNKGGKNSHSAEFYKNQVKSLENRLEQAIDVRDQALDKINGLEDTIANLRQLLTQSMKGNDVLKAKLDESEKYNKSINRDVIEMSTPPPNFKLKELLKVDVNHGLEIDVTKSKLKQANSEIQKLQTQVEFLSNDIIQVKTKQKDRMAQMKKLLQSKHTQVLGAMRRVEYLLEQTGRYENQIKDKDTYIAKLEKKLIELNYKQQQQQQGKEEEMNNRNASKSSKTRKSMFETDQNENNDVNWNTVFQQCKLGRSVQTTSSSFSNKISVHNSIIDEKFEEYISTRSPPSSPLHEISSNRKKHNHKATVSSSSSSVAANRHTTMEGNTNRITFQKMLDDDDKLLERIGALQM